MQVEWEAGIAQPFPQTAWHSESGADAGPEAWPTEAKALGPGICSPVQPWPLPGGSALTEGLTHTCQTRPPRARALPPLLTSAPSQGRGLVHGPQSKRQAWRNPRPCDPRATACFPTVAPTPSSPGSQALVTLVVSTASRAPWGCSQWEVGIRRGSLSRAMALSQGPRGPHEQSNPPPIRTTTPGIISVVSNSV